MARYLMKPMSKSAYQITLSRNKVGAVLKKDEGWIAAINGKKTGFFSTPAAAFHEACAIANRISLCGEDDRLKAYEVLQERNRKVREEANDINYRAGGKYVRVRNRGIRI